MTDPTVRAIRLVGRAYLSISDVTVTSTSGETVTNHR